VFLVLGAYAVVVGACGVGAGIRGARRGGHWGGLVLMGLASIAAGVMTLAWPGIGALGLLLVIAARSLVLGIFALVAAVRLRKQIRGEWLLALSGILSIAFGIALVLFPGAGALALVMWIGAYALVFGAVLVALAFRIRGFARAPERHVPTTGAPLPAA
jgi:uncharacterized membrane protein HdeD (DUF308 family)